MGITAGTGGGGCHEVKKRPGQGDRSVPETNKKEGTGKKGVKSQSRGKRRLVWGARKARKRIKETEG